MSSSYLPPPTQAVGLADSTIRVLSLDPDDCLQPLSRQALTAEPSSICLVEMRGGSSSTETEANSQVQALFLFVGLQNGILHRTAMDKVTGELADSRAR